MSSIDDMLDLAMSGRSANLYGEGKKKQLNKSFSQQSIRYSEPSFNTPPKINILASTKQKSSKRLNVESNSNRRHSASVKPSAKKSPSISPSSVKKSPSISPSAVKKSPSISPSAKKSAKKSAKPSISRPSPSKNKKQKKLTVEQMQDHLANLSERNGIYVPRESKKKITSKKRLTEQEVSKDVKGYVRVPMADYDNIEEGSRIKYLLSRGSKSQKIQSVILVNKISSNGKEKWQVRKEGYKINNWAFYKDNIVELWIKKDKVYVMKDSIKDISEFLYKKFGDEYLLFLDSREKKRQ
jgi:hypothetical protein